MYVALLLTTAGLLAGGKHAELHPAASQLYVEFPDTVAMRAAYEESALLGLLHDEEVGRFVAHLVGEDPATYDLGDATLDLTEGAIGESPVAGLIETLLVESESLSLSVSGVQVRGLADALAQAEREPYRAALAHLAGAQVRLVVDFPAGDEARAAHVRDALVALLSENLPGEESVAHLARTPLGHELDARVWRSKSLAGREVFTALDGTRLIAGIGSDAAQAFAAQEHALSGDERYLELATGFQPPRGAAVYESYVDLAGLSEGVTSLARLMDLPGEVADYAAAGVRAFAPSDRLASRTRVRLVDGQFVEETLERLPEAHGSHDILGSTPVSRAAFELVPEEAVAVWASTLDKDALAATLTDLLAEISGQDPEALLATLASEHGLDPRRDVVDALGHNVVFYTLPFSGIGTPKMFLALDLDQPDRFATGLQSLAEALVSISDGALEFTSRPYRKSPFLSLAPAGDLLPATNGGMLGMAPDMFSPSLSVGVVEGRAIVSLSSMYTKREMKRLLGGEGAPHALAAEGSRLPEDVGSYGETDWGAILGTLYGAAKGWLPMVQQGMGDLPFPSDALPGDDVFARHLRPTTSWTRRVPLGQYSYKESSFGPETPALLSMVAVGGVFMAGSVFEPAEAELFAIDVDPYAEDSVGDPTADTLAALRRVKIGLVVHKSDLGHYPATLAELLTPTANYPSGYLDGNALPKDGWGHELVYALTPDAGSFRIWSVGPDGVDQGGEGDDVDLARGK
ncbi:MAG: type II secretion system protein GspG [Planctomycetes bacterium]|nr:type II secretion system protein GspG [Planctomycetota bacterium]